MIDKHYIDSAIKIRKEYLGFHSKLEQCHVQVKKIAENLMDETKELDKLKDTLDKYKTPEEAQNAIFQKLNDIDLQHRKISDIYKPINDKIEELRKQEVILYENIRRAYPNLSQEQIVDIINENLNKKV